ncbi:MAG: reverse transcriptase family protein [Paraclostridium sordellii]
MEIITHNYKFEDIKLYNINEIEILCDILGVSRGYFNYFNFKKEIGYDTYINKKGRKIEKPTGRLKIMQRNIHNELSKINFPKWVVSCNKGVSYIDNAKLHKDSLYVITLDIKDFYSNCKSKDVHKFFIDYMNTSIEISNIIVRLICREDRLPTGAPSSQLVAYLSHLEMFEKIQKICRDNKLKLSLYVDDLTISSDRSIDNKIINSIILEIKKYGFEINSKKRRYYGKSKSKKITGVIINKNNELKVPNRLKKEVIDLFKELKCINIDRNNSTYLYKVRKLRGKLNACRCIEPNIFKQINIELLKIEDILIKNRAR